MKERVQKLMALANVGSRRACEDLIRQGRVRVNGAVIQLGDQADPQTDTIVVDGQPLAFPKRHTYLAFHKPRNVLSTDKPHKDDNRRTVRDYVPVEGHLFTVGRLDADSEGLMVLTDDGDLANRLSHPRYNHTKTYKAVVYGLPTRATLDQWESGVVITDAETGESFRTAPCSVKIVDGGRETTLRIVMAEGKKRQIRRVAAQLGHPVKSLVRTHIGRLGIGALRPGEWRELTPEDLEALCASAPEPRAIRPGAAQPRSQRSTQGRPNRSDSRRPASGGRRPGQRRSSRRRSE